MGFRVVNQDTVLDEARKLVKGVTRRVWITSPWITGRAANMLLRDVLPRIETDGIDVRLVYRVKEATDLQITDLAALQSFEDAGCEVRYSTRLHAKLVLVDDRAIVSSSNLTSTAGYGRLDPSWRNEELGIYVEDDTSILNDLESEFEAIWDAASGIDPDTLGIAMDFPSVHEYKFVAIREVKLGEYVTAEDAFGNIILGHISGITAYNRSFPQMNQSMWITQGYGGAGEGQRRTEIPDLQTLFSHPSKEHGFLVTKTFFEPESVFRIANVHVLRHLVGDRLVSAAVPIAPGSDVIRARGDLLHKLLGQGDIRVGTIRHHPEVQVALRGREIISKHMAVLGMTGSGKSNAVMVLVREFLTSPGYDDLRVFIVDTHGEYAIRLAELSPDRPARLIDLDLRRSILEEDVIKELAGFTRRDHNLASFVARVADAADALDPSQDLDELLAGLEAAAAGDPQETTLRSFVETARETPDLCLRADDRARVVEDGGSSVDIGAPGLYVLDLRQTYSMTERAHKAGALMTRVFNQKRADPTIGPALVVLEEAQNYVPERTTGWMAETRTLSGDPAIIIATEGRKFDIGLIVSTQRPARVNKDILSQCNTQLVFRVVNVEDLNQVRDSFEAASRSYIDELQAFETGVGVAGGTALDMVVPLKAPLFPPTEES